MPAPDREERGLMRAEIILECRIPVQIAAVVEDQIKLDFLCATFAHPDVRDTRWNAAYEAVIRSIAASLTDRKRCVGLHLAYGVGDDTPAAKEAVRAFFQSYLDRMSEILAEAMPRKLAETIAADALVRLESATLLLALFDDPQAMERVVDAVLTDASRAARAQRG